MKRIGKCTDGMIEVLLTPDEYESVRELPPPPVCLLCGEPSNWLMRIGYGSKYDGDWICPDCLDRAVHYMVKWTDNLPKVTKTTKSYQIVEDRDAWDKALEHELDEHAGAWETLAKGG